MPLPPLPQSPPPKAQTMAAAAPPPPPPKPADISLAELSFAGILPPDLSPPSQQRWLEQQVRQQQQEQQQQEQEQARRRLNSQPQQQQPPPEPAAKRPPPPPAERSSIQIHRSIETPPDDDSATLAANVRTEHAPLPPPPPPSLTRAPLATHACFTHEGGVGGLGKDNQDSFFVARPSAAVTLYGVFDGHGKRHGTLAARVAAMAVRDHLCTRCADLLAAGPARSRVLTDAFAAAHQAVWDAILARGAKGGTMRAHGTITDGGFLLERLPDEDGDEEWDAADGGTTGTVAALVRGEGGALDLVVAVVGDSAAVLLAGDTHAHKAKLTLSESIFEDHSPSHVAECERLRSHPRGRLVQWLYDAPGGEEIPIFRFGDESGQPIGRGGGSFGRGGGSGGGRGGGSRLPVPTLDKESQRRAEEAGVSLKNAKGDYCTILLMPEQASLTHLHPSRTRHTPFSHTSHSHLTCHTPI